MFERLHNGRRRGALLAAEFARTGVCSESNVTFNDDGPERGRHRTLRVCRALSRERQATDTRRDDAVCDEPDCVKQAVAGHAKDVNAA